MIRRKISTGVLRATKSTGNLRASALAQATVSTSQQQTAGLASATLLSSQRNWGKEKVSTLKIELKKRGLSQSGLKSDLIDRLKSSDTSSILPPMPSIPSSHQSSSGFSRHLSTSATTRAPKKKSNSKEVETEADTAETPIVSVGPEVVSLLTEAPPKEEPTPAEVSIAPGLPATKADEKPKKDSLHLRMPTPEEHKEVPQNIPVEPDNFRTPEPTPEPTSSVPKVVTVASPITHTAGGPTHALHETVDASTLEETAETVKSEVGSLSSVIVSALNAPGKAISSADIGSALPTIGAPAGFQDGKQTAHKPSGKPLDSEEKKGLWILGGIVGLGLLLGGGKKEKKDKKGYSSDHSSSKSAGGVRGDAAWEKASGANIVGHGARKD